MALRLMLLAALLAISVAAASPSYAVIDTDWSVYLRANCTGGRMSDLLVGTMWNASDYWRNSNTLPKGPENDGDQGTPGSGKAEIGSGVIDDTGYFHSRALSDRRYKIDTSNDRSHPKTWNLYTRINGGASGTITLTGWVNAKLDAGDVVVELWKTAEYGVLDKNPIWIVPTGVTGTGGSPNLTSYPIDYTGSDIQLKLVAYVSADPASPEPAGMAALLIGLAGLGGFVRRKCA
ncbi:MAG: PEP-CTERM sorting domain-containing protein [Armatimonadetes bacterium]|nr:PEP-CTERM sorting domain-containing protein [Armatimonadota bacterium]